MSDTQDSTTSAQNSVLQSYLAKAAVRTVVGVIIGLLALLAVQMYFDPSHSLDPTLMNLLSLAVGVLLGNLGTVFGWSFGSSPQSKAKDQTIATLVAKVPDHAPAPEPEAK